MYPGSCHRCVNNLMFTLSTVSYSVNVIQTATHVPLNTYISVIGNQLNECYILRLIIGSSAYVQVVLNNHVMLTTDVLKAFLIWKKAVISQR